MEKFISYTKAFCLAGALSLAATEASATILLSATNAANASGAVPTDLDLNGAAIAGGTTLAFITPIAETVAITFNAECAALGTPGQWTAIEIFVDPAGAAGPTLVAPTSTSRAFCSGDSTAGADGWLSATAQGVIRLPAGTHTVRVRATPMNGSPGWWVGDSSIVISDQ
jgi:hypothetical protein